ncbi:VOC family protein [Bacillus sp. FJAT-49736]|uniref:VOC family protein n=1 Tax=Bacillus sp. FJAT-49736 TaxID=2833582 RepID=UPI001BC9EB55|nr:VOC family protein [Bacillus sp. FJAT-49736]MBS4174666.1 VOC family protein [Bacillus sp. FJAT-49736]
MQSPIMNQINTIFVHVSDLRRSVEWYSKLLGQDYDLSKVSPPVYNININHYTGLTLDAGPNDMVKQINPSSYPLFNFHTDNINEAYEYINLLGYEIESKMVRFDDFAFFTVRDPDLNIIMICNG